MPKKFMPKQDQSFFVFDAESIGLHGEAFAVAGGIYIDGSARSEFRFSCQPSEAQGAESDRNWVRENVPVFEITHRSPRALRHAFWTEWRKAKDTYPEITMAAECLWQVEANFLSSCIADEPDARRWSGPYPFHEISSFMLAAGMDPMAVYEREASERPAHDPLADARLSARLLAMALRKLNSNQITNQP